MAEKARAVHVPGPGEPGFVEAMTRLIEQSRKNKEIWPLLRQAITFFFDISEKEVDILEPAALAETISAGASPKKKAGA